MEFDRIWGEIVLIGLAILLYGVCDGAEAALLAAQKSRLQQWKDEGKRGAAAALLIREAPERFLTTIQIAMTDRADWAVCVIGPSGVASVRISPVRPMPPSPICRTPGRVGSTIS